jgi:hypothetical protein
MWSRAKTIILILFLLLICSCKNQINSFKLSNVINKGKASSPGIAPPIGIHPNSQSCSLTNGMGTQLWDGSNWGSCKLATCNVSFHSSDNVCVYNMQGCLLPNAATAMQSWNGSAWGACTVTSCNANYMNNSNTCVSTTTPNTNNYPVIFLGNDKNLQHQIGASTSPSSWSVLSTSSPAFLTYGPYSTLFQNGTYKASFSLRVDNNSADDLTIGYIDVHDTVTDSVIARREFHRREFTAPMIFQNFDLTFSTSGSNNLEFRVYYYGYSFLEYAKTSIDKIDQYTSPDFLFYANDPLMDHLIGRPAGTNKGWSTITTDGSGFMTYGPYTIAVPTGTSTATFSLLLDNNSADNGTVLRIEAYNSSTRKVLAYRIINRQDFLAPMTFQDFDLIFELSSASNLEFRVYSYGISYIEHLKTIIRPDHLTLDSLWTSNAHFEPRLRNFLGNLSSLVAMDGAWYAFTRQAPANSTPTCVNRLGSALQTMVSKSLDHGITWTTPIVAMAAKGTGPDGCMVGDGGMFFDAETNVWHGIYQCLAETGGWNLCHYSRSGSSPVGTFSADTNNPIVTGGQLWSQICSGPGKSCPSTMIDEGTAQIIKKENGYFYVTFHGANYENGTGARGVARTLDFKNWETFGADLPGDALLSAKDCNPWSVNWNAGGCIGFGDASLIRSNGYNYILAEAADKSLGCTAGQNWFFGLMRSTSLSPSGTWDSYSSNPFVIDLTAAPPGCALQYMTFVRDRGDLFLQFGFYESDGQFPNMFYQLVNGPGAKQVIVK